MEVKDAVGAAVLEYLRGSYNYVAWSIQVQTYLVAKDLWDTIAATAKPPKQEDDETAFKAWSDKNYMALRVIKNSCRPHICSEIGEISFAKDAWNILANKYLLKVDPQVLDNDNYVEWSVKVKDLLMACDLWDVVEATAEPPNQEDDDAAFHAWRKSMALHVIQNSCEPDTLFEIREISSAKVAWNTLAEKYLPKNTSLDVLQVLKEENYMDWSVQVKNYLIARDLWEIIEENNKPPRQKDDEAAFKGWSEKNFMALHVIQISCGSDAFSSIKKIRTAKIAWETLAEWNQIKAFKKSFEDVVRRGDWNAVQEFLMPHSDYVGLKFKDSGETALHVAVDAGNEHIVEKLVARMSEQELAVQDNSGETALFKAICEGNYRMTECMLRKNVNLVSIKNSSGELPVVQAALYYSKKLARYIYSRTPEEDLKSENGKNGATLCSFAIYGRKLDIALDLIERCPSLALARDKNDRSPLYALVSAFRSENQLVFWKRWMCKC